MPFISAKTPQAEKARQVIFQISLDPPELCDTFFNGRDGLRARYWHSPEAGDAATRHFIRLLLPLLLSRATRAFIEPLHNAIPLNEEELRLSLEMVSAKVWPVECERDDRIGLEVRRWRLEGYPTLGAWRWMPERCNLNVKGALIDDALVQYIPQGKRDRAQQLHFKGHS